MATISSVATRGLRRAWAAAALAATFTLVTPGAAPGENKMNGRGVPPRTPWVVEIGTEGGFSGRGTGGVKVSSGGEVEASAEAGRCAGRLTPPEQRRLARLVSRAEPRRWLPSYAKPGNPHGHADQFRYSLKLSVGATGGLKNYETSWFDETASVRPSDLRALSDAAWAVRGRVLKGCTPR